LRPSSWPRLTSAALLLALAATTASAGAKDALPPEVAQALARAKVPASSVAMLVAPLPPAPGATAAAPRLTWRADAPMSPASVMKLVTTYAGLDLLGPGYFWKTRALAQGAVQDGALRGNLLIEGAGDPKLVRERIEDFLQAILAKGVRRVDGDILLDRRVFSLPPHDAARFDADPLRPYNAGPDGLLLNFKALVFKFTPDAASGRVRVASEPPIANVAIAPDVPAAAGPCGNWRGKLAAGFDDPARVVFAGSYPASCGEQSWGVAYADPESYAPRVIEAMWQAAGGQLGGHVKWLTDGAASGQPLVTEYSLPLAELIGDINKFSNNVMAQQLFLTLSVTPAQAGQAAQPGTFAASRAVLARWWRQRLGPRVAAPTLENGSGLSRTERITAAALAALLAQAAGAGQAAAFEQSLPLSGVDDLAHGLAARNPASEALGRARLKTGTLRDVTAVAGYVQGRSGQRYAVVGLINHPNAPAARPALDRLVEWAVRDDRAIASKK
jgi:D-alanyl-D-alanine carboxypeptidase/D-alanyl-D-alanine-endopeptidase (penicillin-binding protein 4)